MITIEYGIGSGDIIEFETLGQAIGFIVEKMIEDVPKIKENQFLSFDIRQHP